MVREGKRGVEIMVVDYDLSTDENYMLTRMEQTDILIDASYRADPSVPVIPNEWMESVPQHGVLLDLSADPYNFEVDPPLLKGLEIQYIDKLAEVLEQVLEPANQDAAKQKIRTGTAS